MRLNSRELAIYRTGRILLWGIFVIAAVTAFSHFFFPDQQATYDFAKGQIKKELPGQEIVKRDLERESRIMKDATETFDIETNGNYTSIEVRADLEEGALSDMSDIRIRKGFKATFVEIGDEASFPPGSLLRSGGDFFFVLPDSTLSHFDSASTVEYLGWSEDSFIALAQEEIDLYPISSDSWTVNDGYPEGALVTIEENFYAFRNGALSPFVSESAFLSRYPREFSAKGNMEVLGSIPQGDEMIGFSNSTLLSFDSAVYILDGATAHPIADVPTFESFGLDWDDVIPANSEELGMYRKGRQFTILDTHPEGSVFRDKTTNEIYILDEKTLRPVKSSALKSFLARRSAVVADIGATDEPLCAHSEISSEKKGGVACVLNVSSLADVPGNTYRLTVTPINDIRIATFTMRLTQDISWSNLRTLLANLKAQVIDRF